MATLSFPDILWCARENMRILPDKNLLACPKTDTGRRYLLTFTMGVRVVGDAFAVDLDELKAAETMGLTTRIGGYRTVSSSSAIRREPAAPPNPSAAIT